MRYLLDTHTLLWSIGKSHELSGRAKKILEDTTNEILVSAITLWEISLKYGLGKMAIGSMTPENIPEYCDKLSYGVVPLGPVEASTYHNLKQFQEHKDPFDRMLIHQCIRMKATLLSRDGRMTLYKKYGLSCIW